MHMTEDAKRIIDDSTPPFTARWKGGVLTAPLP